MSDVVKVGVLVDQTKSNLTLVIPDGMPLDQAAKNCLAAITHRYRPEHVQWIEGGSSDLSKLLVSTLTCTIAVGEAEDAKKTKTRKHKPAVKCPADWN